ncbi:hypothetical protein [Croceicoccus marinus]|uniref:Argininosuccinate lyase n=1 Tax=Croceicoccus marinus TaxID=450378 RepID=A0A1Z1FB75_9SPHN|nr:hypothetical protein [Croceicoccus marinus]ARU15983.1 hypothetical protein A9D14_07005 [Croceicoccus marinus]
MRRIAALALLMLAACNSEPDFDERFEKAEAETRQLATEIDAELAKAEAGKPQPDATAEPESPDDRR